MENKNTVFILLRLISRGYHRMTKNPLGLRYDDYLRIMDAWKSVESRNLRLSGEKAK